MSLIIVDRKYHLYRRNLILYITFLVATSSSLQSPTTSGPVLDINPLLLSRQGRTYESDPEPRALMTRAFNSLFLDGLGFFSLMRLQDGDGLFHLCLERLLILQHVKQLRVVDLQQHAGDFPRQIGVGLLDERE